MTQSRAKVVLAAYLAVLFALTLGGMYQPNAPRNFVLFQSMEHDFRKGGREFVVNFLGNMVVFWPMGVLVPMLAGRGWGKVAGWSFGLSLFIEVLQGLSGRRVMDVDDLILNTVGGLMGYAIGRVAVALGRSASKNGRVEAANRSPGSLEEV